MPEQAAVSLTAQGFGKLDAVLTRLARSNRDLRVPLKRIGAHMHRSVAMNFRDQGIPELGISWAPLSQWTLKARRKGKGAGSAKILMDTGHMRMSVVSSTGPGSIYTLTKDALVIGTNVPYAVDHQPPDGSTETVKPSKRIPNVKVREHRRRSRSGKRYLVRSFTREQFVPETRQPARPFLAIKPSDADTAARILADWEMEQIRKGWPEGK